MSNLKGTKTHENLKAAFAGESQANRRYLYFAQQADIEGLPEIAGNFKETADGETQIRGNNLLVAAGRAANVEGLGLEKAGIKFDRRGTRHRFILTEERTDGNRQCHRRIPIRQAGFTGKQSAPHEMRVGTGFSQASHDIGAAVLTIEDGTPIRGGFGGDAFRNGSRGCRRVNRVIHQSLRQFYQRTELAPEFLL